MVFFAILLWPLASSPWILAAMVEIDPPPANTDPTLSAIRFQATELADGKVVSDTFARARRSMASDRRSHSARRRCTRHYQPRPIHGRTSPCRQRRCDRSDHSTRGWIGKNHRALRRANGFERAASRRILRSTSGQLSESSCADLYKLGCNGGGCHGKAAGQNGFRLSLLGFEPREDYEHLVAESRGRRLSPASPDQSLLLTKSLNESPHGGGQRLGRDSYEYRLLRRWIAQAMPYGSAKDPSVVRIQVSPNTRRMGRNAQQQLSVLAHYSDGTVEDITRTASMSPINRTWPR